MKQIPISFKLFSTTYNVVWNDKRMNDINSYEFSDYGRSEIRLSKTSGNNELSEDNIYIQ